MEKIHTLRGFKDIFGVEIVQFKIIEGVGRKYCELLGFREVELPILEKTDLFVRSIGDTTDIVEKEMFTFTDLGGDSLTLRPEATAGMVRAYLQQGLYAKERVTKLFTIGPMFRHERPQKGRFREFHQMDIEVFGVKEPLIDAELIWMIFLMLGELGVTNYKIEVNSVGCRQCMEPFRSVLAAYFETKKDKLCEDCLKRLSRNPLRIFDCKKTQCIEVTAQSPLLFDHLCGDCREHFDTFVKHMNDFGIVFDINKRLVRGLDYYTRTVFEVSSEELGAQKAFVAGGRYDNLVDYMAGPPTPGIGFAIGIERLAMLIDFRPLSGLPSCFFAYLGEGARGYLIPILRAFADEGMKLNHSYEGKSLKSQMRYADSMGASYVLILGDEEIGKGMIIFKDMRNKSQYEFPLDPQKIIEEFKKYCSHLL